MTGMFSREEMTSIFEGLQTLKEASGPNKHDQVDVLILACLAEGIDTGGHIVGTIAALGFDPIHVRIRLTKGAGSNPGGHLWWRDPKGVYRCR